ncbi:MAG: transposase [Marinobacterium sp.]
MATSKIRTHSPRRSAHAWQRLLAEQAESGLTVTEFCRQASISPASFYRWQGLLREGLRPSGRDSAEVADAAPVVAVSHRAPDFVDLGALENLAASTRQKDAPAQRVELRLDLGAGLVLHLVRG